jgi:hypothetical protein
VSHFHQVDIGKQAPDRQVDRFGYEPGLHEDFVVQNCESLFLTRKMDGFLARFGSSHLSCDLNFCHRQDHRRYGNHKSCALHFSTGPLS